MGQDQLQLIKGLIDSSLDIRLVDIIYVISVNNRYKFSRKEIEGNLDLLLNYYEYTEEYEKCNQILHIKKELNENQST